MKRLTVLLRSTSAQNKKPRPDWFSKRAALSSLLSAAEKLSSRGVEVKLVVFADGGLPEDVEALVVGSDVEIVHYSAGSSRSSMLTLYRRARSEVANGLVWFAEDDYLYTEQSLCCLFDAYEQTNAAYFCLHRPDDTWWHAHHPSQPLGAVSGATISVRHQDSWTEWQPVTHTTSTFGGRVDAVKSDTMVLTLATYAGSPFAHSTNMALQGKQPFAWTRIFYDLELSFSNWHTSLVRPPMRILVNIAALMNRRKSRVLLAPETDRVCHMEEGFITADRDWEELALTHTTPKKGIREGDQ